MVAKLFEHKKQSSVPDDSPASYIRPSDWNLDAHDMWLGRRSVAIGTDTLLNDDCWCLISYSSGSAIAVTAPTPTPTGNFRAGWFTFIRNAGISTVTITPTAATINGAASLAVPGGRSIMLFSDGANYTAIEVVSPSNVGDLVVGKVNRTGDTMTGILTLVGAPANPLDAATKQYVDGAPYVAEAGDAMTGPLTLPADPTANLHAATKQYVDARVAKSGDAMTGPLTLPSAPTADLHAATKQYVDARVAKAGDTMTGNLRISKATPALELNKGTAGTDSTALLGLRNSLSRWNLELGNGTAEVGGNVGSDCSLKRYDDAGNFLDNSIIVARTDGKVTLNGDPTNALHAATKQYADTDRSGCGRLSRLNSTTVQFTPYNGNRIKINGQWRQIPAAGITAATTNIVLNNAAGQSLVANTNYYVTVDWQIGSLRLSYWTTNNSHAADATAGNVGVEVIVGAPMYSLVGMVRTNASVQFVDDPHQYYVISWFNRRALRVIGGNVGPSSTTATSTWTELNVNGRINFLSWTEEGVEVFLTGLVFGDIVGLICYSNIGLDSASNAILVQGPYAQAGTVNQQLPVAGASGYSVSEGYHYITPIGFTSGGGTGTWYVFVSAMIRG